MVPHSEVQLLGGMGAPAAAPQLLPLLCSSSLIIFHRIKKSFFDLEVRLRE